MKNNKITILNFIRILSISLFLTYAMTMLAPAAYAQVAKPSIDFNHMKTGFPLTGAHVKVECETCHTGGLFKGTPKDCAGCHSVGRRVVAPVKSGNHMITSDACDTCHTNTVTFIGARFNHIGVKPKDCMSCHRGLTAPGKPNGHVQTNASCDSCHRTSSWIPAGFDHAAPLPVCDTCHGPAGLAKGKDPINHVPTNGKSCDACHTNFVTFLGAIFDHAGATQCATCHITGTYGAKTKPNGHIPSGSVSCDLCHKGTGYISFAGSTMNHDSVLSISCTTCHNGSYISQKGTLGLGAQSKQTKPNHVVTTAECSDCHLGRSSFQGGYFNHVSPPPGQVVGGNCNSCHDGTHALGKTNTATHSGTTAQCDTCHGNANNYTSFAGAVFSHNPATVTAVCGTCHLGQTAAKTKSSGHIQTSGNDCGACHVTPVNAPPDTFTLPVPTMRHNAVLAIACVTCHGGLHTGVKGTLGIGARATNPGHLTTNNAPCSNCHTSSDSADTWKSSAVYTHDPAKVTAVCGTCHIPGTSGALMISTRPNHIKISGNACDACHNRGFIVGGFANPKMYHPAVSSFNCVECHDGTHTSEKATLGLGAQGLTSIPNHIPTNSAIVRCDVCHTDTTYTTFTKLATSPTIHTAGIAPVGTACLICHQANTYKGVTGSKKSVNHDKNGSTDCKDSGCHKPGANGRGTVYTSW